MRTLILFFLISFNASAIELKFFGPCTDTFIMKVEVTEEFSNVGELTVKTLSKFSIPYIGSEENLQSAFFTPTATNAIEVLSPTEGRYYGWCFSVDGVSPETFPHENDITPETKSIVWTFGFAHLKDGEWLSQCTPAYQIRPKFLCED
jgi:hypothetical protein